MNNTTATAGISEEQIDEKVIQQADNDAAWEDWIMAKREKPEDLLLPAELAARAAFIAKLHHKTSMKEWVENVVKERVDFEEAAFAGLKQALSAM